MKLKKVIAVLSSAALMSSLTAQVAGAQEIEEKVYNYVALGDSIAAGFGLEKLDEQNPIGSDRAIILTEDLIENPVDCAYPNIFGGQSVKNPGYLATLGERYGYEVNATNLAIPAYRAEDIIKVITEEDSIGDFAMQIFGMTGKNREELKQLLGHYHELYEEYLTDADLVSVQLGGNDYLLIMLFDMYGQQNPVVQAIAGALTASLLGMDVQTSFTWGIGSLTSSLDGGEVTPEMLAEAAQYFKGLQDRSGELVVKAANSVEGVIDAVKSVNETADIALLNMYNPYGDGFGLDNLDDAVKSQLQEMIALVKAIFAKAAEKYTDDSPVYVITQTHDALPTGAVSVVMAQQAEKDIDSFSNLINSLDGFTEEELKEALTKVVEEIGVPVARVLAAEGADPYIKQLDGLLADIANRKGCVLVDTYGITPSGSFDPHPGEQGHMEIAKRMYNTLESLVISRMGGEVIDQPTDPDQPTNPDQPTDPDQPVSYDDAYDYVDFEEDPVTVYVGKSHKLVLVSENGDSYATDPRYWNFKSADEDFATVDENGVVRGQRQGTVVISATPKYYANLEGEHNNQTIFCTVKVVSNFPAYSTPIANPSNDAVSRSKINGYVTVVADSSSNGPVANTGGLFGEESNAPAAVAAGVLGVIALGFVVVARKRRHS